MTSFDFDALKSHALPDLAEAGALLLAFDEARPGAAILQARAAQRAGCRDVVLQASSEALLQLALALPDVRVIASNATPGEPKPFAGAFDARGNTEIPTSLNVALRLAGPDGARAAKSKKVARLFVLDETEASESSLETLQNATREANAPMLLPGVAVHVALVDGTLHRVEGRSDSGLNAKDEARGAHFGAFGPDVLLGVAGALLSRGLSPDASALWAASIYAVAAQAAVKELGEDSVCARDLIERLPGALRFLKKTADAKKATGGFGLVRG